MRFSREDSMPVELLLLGGTTFALEGRQILKAPRKIDYVFASRYGDGFHFETSGETAEGQLPIADLEAIFSRSKSSKT